MPLGARLALLSSQLLDRAETLTLKRAKRAKPKAPVIAATATFVSMMAPAPATAPPGRPGPAAPPGSASAPPAPSTTSTTAAPFINAQRTGKTISLTAVDPSQVVRLAIDGQVSDFQTNEPAYSCLNGSTLNVFTNLKGQPVAVGAAPGNCVTQDFLLP